jgi:hypothetical protein
MSEVEAKRMSCLAEGCKFVELVLFLGLLLLVEYEGVHVGSVEKFYFVGLMGDRYV